MTSDPDTGPLPVLGRPPLPPAQPGRAQARPDEQRPDDQRPDDQRPDVQRPDVQRPDVPRPDGREADAPRTDAAAAAGPPVGEPRTVEQPLAGPPPVGSPPADPGTVELPAAGAAAADPGPAPDPRPADLPPPARPSRAGRDLAAAIGVGTALAAIILTSLLVWRPGFLAVLTVAILVAVVELTRALEAGGARAPVVPVLVGALAMIGLAWTRGPTGLLVAFLLTVLAVLLWRLGDGPEDYLHDAAAGVLVAAYVPLLSGFAVLLLVPDDGVARVLAFITTVVGNDVGGYAAGVLFGRHPMAPSVSPKKSWEGMAGSVLACVLVATPIVTFAVGAPWWGGVLFGVALAVTATAGDLGESLIKRDLGIKDMGNLLPGHGGIMDRLDSLLPSAAVAYLLLAWLAPPG